MDFRGSGGSIVTRNASDRTGFPLVSGSIALESRSHGNRVEATTATDRIHGDVGDVLRRIRAVERHVNRSRSGTAFYISSFRINKLFSPNRNSVFPMSKSRVILGRSSIITNMVMRSIIQCNKNTVVIRCQSILIGCLDFTISSCTALLAHNLQFDRRGRVHRNGAGKGSRSAAVKVTVHLVGGDINRVVIGGGSGDAGGRTGDDTIH